MDFEKWTNHFLQNKVHRSEPDWGSNFLVPLKARAALTRSLEQFELGDGGGPASLIAWNADRFQNQTKTLRNIVDLWFAEEKEHSRLLGCAVRRYGGKKPAGHWSFTAFCLCRKWFGVQFELTVLLLTEISATVYYRLLKRHCPDPAIRQMCRLIIRDETGHVAFHRDRLATDARSGPIAFGRFWELRFRTLGHAAATMLWVNHAPCLKALGATTREFYRELRRELSKFILQLRRDLCSANKRRLIASDSPTSLRSSPSC